MEDSSYVIAALSHPFFKANSIGDSAEKENAKLKLKQLLSDIPSPLSEKSNTSIIQKNF